VAHVSVVEVEGPDDGDERAVMQQRALLFVAAGEHGPHRFPSHERTSSKTTGPVSESSTGICSGPSSTERTSDSG
jgi:hypothetical protein